MSNAVALSSGLSVFVAMQSKLFLSLCYKQNQVETLSMWCPMPDWSCNLVRQISWCYDVACSNNAAECLNCINLIHDPLLITTEEMVPAILACCPARRKGLPNFYILLRLSSLCLCPMHSKSSEFAFWSENISWRQVLWSQQRELHTVAGLSALWHFLPCTDTSIKLTGLHAI